MVKRYVVFIPIFIVFLMFSLQLRWTDIDNQAFNKITMVERYGGDIIPRDIGAAFLFLCAAVFASDIYKSAKLLPTTFYIAALLPFLSIFWTVDTERTVNVLVVLSLNIIYVVIAIRLLGEMWTIRIFWFFSIALVAVSTVLALAGDAHVLMASTHDGQWRGLFNHKNVYSPFAVVVMLIAIFGGHLIPRNRLLRGFTLALCTLSLLRAGSSTGIAALVLSIGAGLLASMPARRKSIRIFVYAVAVAATVVTTYLLLSEIDTVTAVLDRDITLTGRTSLWAAAVPFANEVPFGYGFGTSGGDQIIDAMRRQSGWVYASSTHNVYITRALDIGWFGMTLMVLWSLPYLAVLQRAEQFETRRLLASIAALYYIGGITEVAGLFYPSASFIVILMLVSAVRQPALARRQQAAANRAHAYVSRDCVSAPNVARPHRPAFPSSLRRY